MAALIAGIAVGIIAGNAFLAGSRCASVGGGPIAFGWVAVALNVVGVLAAVVVIAMRDQRVVLRLRPRYAGVVLAGVGLLAVLSDGFVLHAIGACAN